MNFSVAFDAPPTLQDVMIELAKTCWRGMQVRHPRDWELAIVSGVNEKPRCLFTDRVFHRLDLKWHNLTYVPNLQLILTRHKQSRKDQESRFTEASGLPPEWQGLIRRLPQGSVLQAVRFFREQRYLVEATITWPQSRQKDLEREVLSSVEPQEQNQGPVLWQAMGVSTTIPAGMNLSAYDAKVGRVKLDFKQAGKRPLQLIVERISTTGVGPDWRIANWMHQQIPNNYSVVSEEPLPYGVHVAHAVHSKAGAGLLSKLRGMKWIRLDLAWTCPVEDRAYRVVAMQISHQDEISLPEHFEVRCCRAAPVVAASRAGG